MYFLHFSLSLKPHQSISLANVSHCMSACQTTFKDILVKKNRNRDYRESRVRRKGILEIKVDAGLDKSYFLKL